MRPGPWFEPSAARQSYAGGVSPHRRHGWSYGGRMTGTGDRADDELPRDPFDTDFDHDDDSPPAWFAGQHLPHDAQRMGLTNHVPDGALLDFAGRLDATKTKHRVTAWVLLVVFAFPVLMYVVRLVQAVLPG